ncbi:MAG: transposase, partial [Prevotellaceae bacterium]|nr:transposase [Prevotellaceae bacterium]
NNKQYFRFRHFGKELITMDFAIFAIAFNIGKLFNKGKNPSKSIPKSPVFAKNIFFIIFLIPKSDSHLCQKKFYSQNLKIAA